MYLTPGLALFTFIYRVYMDTEQEDVLQPMRATSSCYRGLGTWTAGMHMYSAESSFLYHVLLHQWYLLSLLQTFVSAPTIPVVY